MEYSYITKLDMGELKALRGKLVAQLSIVNERIQGQILSECSICEKPELAYDDIPEGWKWVIDGYLLCDSCMEKFNRK